MAAKARRLRFDSSVQRNVGLSDPQSLKRLRGGSVLDIDTSFGGYKRDKAALSLACNAKITRGLATIEHPFGALAAIS